MRFGLFVIAVCLVAGAALFAMQARAGTKNGDLMSEKPENFPYATLAGGCFWCVESEFRGFPGVVYTVVGYTGGTTENPTYHDVSSGATGHAEAVQVYYDPAKTDYRTLLTHFMTKAHDPTQLNRQGVDKGTQYRSAIFYQDAQQRQIAEDVVAGLTAQKRFKEPIVTDIKPAGPFWRAEEYHQQYYEKYEQEHGQPHIREWLKHQGGKNG